MLPAKNRLKLSHKSRDKFLGANKISSDEFRLVAKSKEGVFKAAITVSKKVAPRAVDRNRIRRIVSEALRGQAVFQGDLLVVVNKNITGLKTNEVKGKIISLISKLK